MTTTTTTPKKGRKNLPPLNVQKAYVASDEATLVQLIECYGYLVFKPNGHLWLTGLVPKHQREMVAERIRQHLTAAKAANQQGRTLVSG